ncbi:MAG: chromate transporter [Lachnospiraceae bacterium]|nr:chromate transporter [Lachnospiraceae bacterium]
MERWKRLWVIFIVMAKIGLFTFGGGWSIIVQIQNEFVEKRGWMTEEQIVDYMSLAKSFPGIMIINMSVFCGYTMCGITGAFAAAIGLSLPALGAIALVTYFYNSLKTNVFVAKILNGVRSVVIPIILSAAVKLKKTALKEVPAYVIAAITFVVCALSSFNKAVIVLIALVAGLLIWRGGIEDDLS